MKQIVRNGGGVDGLDGAMSVTTSPDGEFLYSASGRFTDESSIGVFKIQNDGTLSLIQEFICGKEGPLKDFSGANKIAVSPDGNAVIVTGTRSTNLAVFDRDLQTGKLRFVELTPIGSGWKTFTGKTILGPAGIRFDSTGEYFYVSLEGDDSIAVYRRTRPP